MKAILQPRLLSDNGSTYIAGEPAEWLEEKVMGYVRGATLQPRIVSKIEYRPHV